MNITYRYDVKSVSSRRFSDCYFLGGVLMEGIPLVRRINSIYLPVSHKKKAVKWYEDHLGLTHPRGPESDILQLGDGTWVFLEKSITKTTANFATSGWVENGNYEMFSICFETNDAVGLHEKLQNEGVEVEELRDEGSCGIQFIFYDLDGNKFQVFQQPK